MTSVNGAIEEQRAKLLEGISHVTNNFKESVERHVGWAMDEIKRIVANSYIDNCKIDDEKVDEDIDSAEANFED